MLQKTTNNKKGSNFKKQRMTNSVRCNRVVVKLIHRPLSFDSSGGTAAAEISVGRPSFQDWTQTCSFYRLGNLYSSPELCTENSYVQTWPSPKSDAVPGRAQAMTSYYVNALGTWGSLTFRQLYSYWELRGFAQVICFKIWLIWFEIHPLWPLHCIVFKHISWSCWIAVFCLLLCTNLTKFI